MSDVSDRSDRECISIDLVAAYLKVAMSDIEKVLSDRSDNSICGQEVCPTRPTGKNDVGQKMEWEQRQQNE